MATIDTNKMIEDWEKKTGKKFSELTYQEQKEAIAHIMGLTPYEADEFLSWSAMKNSGASL